MKTEFSPAFLNTPDGKLANKILRTCVHCGFCNATCPTYQLLGDENDGPRGRIYLIKQVLEDKPVTQATRTHLDRCLSCRNCETTCPSGVEYGKLIDIGRKVVEQKTTRDFKENLTRKALLNLLPYRNRFSPAIKLGQIFKPLLPKLLSKKIPKKINAGHYPNNNHSRKMIILEGCVQPALSPDINAATARVLDRLSISLIRPQNAGCCGAVNQHLSDEEKALVFVKQNIDAWWEHIENGAEAIIITASGCGTMVKDYAHLLRNDKEYAQKALKVTELCKDISEVIMAEDYARLQAQQTHRTTKNISWHPPCTLQHGQKINGVVEKILTDSGYNLLPVTDSHLCCGSAGTYSILQAEISQQLQSNKIENLTKHKPEMIVTGNIGCQTHLQEVSDVPVVHWIHLLDH
jgi:glycolate oxidase iron-sulfur subunit